MQENLRSVGGLRVLVIEDHADTRAALASYLTMLGCEVGEAANVKEGSRKLARGEWDLFLSDVCLPDGTGFDFSAREGFGSCYAVSMSAHDRSETEAKSAAAGYDRHLQKPIDPGEIEEIAAEAWRHRASPGAASAPGKLHTVIFSSPHAVDPHRLSGIVSPHVSGYSVFAGAGFWRGTEEHTYMLVIVSETDEPVAALVRDLKINFRQESVIQITHPAAAVRFV